MQKNTLNAIFVKLEILIRFLKSKKAKNADVVKHIIIFSIIIILKIITIKIILIKIKIIINIIIMTLNTIIKIITIKITIKNILKRKKQITIMEVIIIHLGMKTIEEIIINYHI